MMEINSGRRDLSMWKDCDSEFELYSVPPFLSSWTPSVLGTVVMIGFMYTWCVHVSSFSFFSFSFLIRRIHARYAWTYN